MVVVTSSSSSVVIACLEEYPKRGDNYRFLQDLVTDLYHIAKRSDWDQLEIVVRKISDLRFHKPVALY